MARQFKIKEGVVPFVESNQKTLDLSRNYHVAYYLVKLSVTHDNSNADLNDEKIWRLINNFRIVADGNVSIKQTPGSKIALNNLLHTGRRGKSSIDTTNGNNKKSYVWGIIPMSIPGMVRSHDTILNTAPYKSLQLLVNWGSSSNVGSGVTVKDAIIDVYSSQLVGYKRNEKETIKYFVENSLQENITNTTTEHTIQMPVNKNYQAFTLMATVDDKRNDNIINRIKIKSGSTVIVDWDAEAIRAMNIFNSHIEDNEDMTGIYKIDFTERGRLSDLLNTHTNFNTLEIVLDVTKQSGTNVVYVLADEVEETGLTEA